MAELGRRACLKRTCPKGRVGSIPTPRTMARSRRLTSGTYLWEARPLSSGNRPLAQLVERVALNHEVGGSSPSGSACIENVHVVLFV